jgi:TolB-like protein/cytochrome c-type biogenesis protein CcmH/NrfG
MTDPSAGEAGQKANSHVDQEPPAEPVVENAPAEAPHAEQQTQGANAGWRNWWRQFRSDFSSAHPDKQLSQIYYIAGILAVAGSVFAGIWAFGAFLFESTTPLGKPEATAVTETAPAPSLSIVVLPFVNLSNNVADDYFADGITDNLTTDLSRALPGSFVVARETAFTYKGKPIDVRQIGRELRVRYALEGSALLDGERVRINARLVDAQMGNEIWADRFDTTRGNLLEVQDAIVGRLSRAIGLQVISDAARRSQRETPGNVPAMDLVLRGQAALNRPSSPTTMMEARDLFEQAVRLQPNNVDALAGMATTYIFEVLNGYYPSGDEERLQRAEPLLDRALALDDRHLTALKAKAALLRAQGKFDDAIAATQAVIALNPGEPWAYKEVALSTMYLGRTADALDWFERAERLGPRDPGRWTWLSGKGQVLLLLGRTGEAITALRAALDSNPAAVGEYPVLAAAYALNGRDDEAHAALAQYTPTHPGATIANFRSLSPVPLKLTDPSYRQQRRRLEDGLRRAGMPE